MKAAFYTQNGAAADVLQVGEQPTPEAGPGEVRVRLAASGVNPADVKLRAGKRHPITYPLVIANSDGAGVVDQVGPGADPAWLGKRVWIHNGQRQGRAFGTAAEYIALDQDLVCELPIKLSFEEGATLGIPCMTAHRAVFWDGSVAGKSILVTGGAGAVGHYAIQLAKWDGARVLATVSDNIKAEHALMAGADTAINYRTENVVERVMAATNGHGVDRIVDVDFAGNLETSCEIIKNCGTICAYATDSDESPRLPVYPLMAKNVSLRFLVLNSVPLVDRKKAQQDIHHWIEEDEPLISIAARYTLDDIVAAPEHVESGAKLGTVVVTL